jgi:hypothetical protein
MRLKASDRVVQSQDALAIAQSVNSVFAHNVAKLAMASDRRGAEDWPRFLAVK